MLVMSRKKAEPMHDLYARIPESLWQQIEKIAKGNKRSVTKEVEWVLEQYANSGAPPSRNPRSEAPS
jgi:hypothetical protein